MVEYTLDPIEMLLTSHPVPWHYDYWPAAGEHKLFDARGNTLDGKVLEEIAEAINQKYFGSSFTWKESLR